jgi:hypothetical protein
MNPVELGLIKHPKTGIWEPRAPRATRRRPADCAAPAQREALTSALRHPPAHPTAAIFRSQRVDHHSQPDPCRR